MDDKLKAIIRLYSTNLKRELVVGDETINAWAIEGIPKKELLKKYSHEEIESIYYNAV